MLKVKLLHPDAKVPTRANATDAGLDLYALDNPGFGSFIAPGNRAVLRTGIAISIPQGYVGRVLPRSGLAVNNGIHVMAGVVDSSYRGEVRVVLANLGNSPFTAHPGDRIAQLVIQKIELWTPQVVEELDDTERGENGFGSSGL
jgi:dUTP pyrophosphatase